MVVSLIRNGLGLILRGMNAATRGSKLERDDEAQAKVNSAIAGLSLYQFSGCPFCIKVRRKMHQLNLPIELRDAKRGTEYRKELEAQGGRSMVPCLRIEKDGQVEWLYESSDIIAYLDNQFG